VARAATSSLICAGVNFFFRNNPSLLCFSESPHVAVSARRLRLKLAIAPSMFEQQTAGGLTGINALIRARAGAPVSAQVLQRSDLDAHVERANRSKRGTTNVSPSRT